jgi:hypothetical protein
MPGSVVIDSLTKLRLSKFPALPSFQRKLESSAFKKVLSGCHALALAPASPYRLLHASVRWHDDRGLIRASLILRYRSPSLCVINPVNDDHPLMVINDIAAGLHSNIAMLPTPGQQRRR